MSDTNEEIVGRVLQGLRSAALPDGMESRILSAVRHRAAATPVAARSRWRIASLAGGVALAGVVCALFFPARRTTPQAALPRSQAISIQAASGPITPLMAATQQSPKTSVRRVKLARGASAKKQELSVVSYPAPPMPLTEQEKLLLRIVHQGDPVQIAMLDPAWRATQYAVEKTAVLEFFEPGQVEKEK